MEEKNSTENKRTISTAIIGGAIIAVLLILSTIWISQRGQSGTNDAVQSVSEMYLRELTARREQGIASRIKDCVNDMQTALKLLTPNDLQSVENLGAFLGRIRTIHGVKQFALVDANGNIFTPEGIAQNHDEYFFVKKLKPSPSSCP